MLLVCLLSTFRLLICAVVSDACQFIDSGAGVAPTMLGRRCFAYVVAGNPQEGLEDAKRAEVIASDWPMGHYLQALALHNLGREAESQEALKNGTALEAAMNSRARTV
jgi:hypothetical protein